MKAVPLKAVPLKAVLLKADPTLAKIFLLLIEGNDLKSGYPTAVAKE